MRRIGIVNRGEPAVRFLATLANLPDLTGVALYTEADRDSLAVRLAPASVCIGAHKSAWLDADAVLAALLATECDAAWLGWGFASEDAEFARTLEAGGITLLAPRPESMALLGDKIAAKQLAERCDVPVAPWAIVTDAAEAEAAALRVGLPLLVKAAGGGGGRGIRRVDRLDEVAEAFTSARDEARRSFRSDGVMLERLVENARHIEVQVLGDGEGRVRVLGLRDCSLQRRRQKVIEEAPAPGLSPRRAEAIAEAALRLCAAARYRSAGTVEFLYVPATDTACFLEVNTRLQVEHPVTEAVYGIDLVRAQIDLARGRSLAEVVPEPLVARGWAVEARVCAEDPTRGFVPTPGRILRFVPPLGPGLRVDTGFAEGDEITAEFDPLIAKIIAWGPDRATAILRLSKALDDTRLVVAGGATNLTWLRSLLHRPEVRDGHAVVDLVDRIAVTGPDATGLGVARVAAAIDRFEAAGDAGEGTDRHRVDALGPLKVYRLGAERFRVVGPHGGVTALRSVAPDGRRVRLVIGDVTHRVEREPGDTSYRVDAETFRVPEATGGVVRAPSAALVLALPVAVGEPVAAGQCVAIVESMKMEVAVLAPRAGVLRRLGVAVGAQVIGGQVIAEIDAAAEGPELPDDAPPCPADAPDPCARRARDRLAAGLLGWDEDPRQHAEDRARLNLAEAPAHLLDTLCIVAAGLERRPEALAPPANRATAPTPLADAGAWLHTLRHRGPAAVPRDRAAAMATWLRRLGAEDLAQAIDDAAPYALTVADALALRRIERAAAGLPAAQKRLAALVSQPEAQVPEATLQAALRLDPQRFGPLLAALKARHVVAQPSDSIDQIEKPQPNARGLWSPAAVLALLTRGGPELPPSRCELLDLDAHGRLVPAAATAPGVAAVQIAVARAEAGFTGPRVLILNDPTQELCALAAPECDRIVAALDLATALNAPVEWVAVSAGARIDMASGTENLDATARVLGRIVDFTQAGGEIHIAVPGICVGAQAYWNAEATMLPHCRGLLVMTDAGSQVLTGKRALDASGCVSAADDLALGGYTAIMGPNGQAQAHAADLPAALALFARHRQLTGVLPGARRPAPVPTVDVPHRDVGAAAYPAELGHGFGTVAEVFSLAHNPDRKRPFAVRPVMAALVDADAPVVPRWEAWRNAETAVVWDTRVGGCATTVIGIENQSLSRLDAPDARGGERLSGGTLYPDSARKVARALNAASGRRPAVVLANLSGFDGSPESLARLQLEFGAELGRAVRNFESPLLFVVLSRYHGGAYVVFSKALNPQLKAVALQGSFASVIGGAPAAAVVFTREVNRRAQGQGEAARAAAQSEVAAEFDAIHTVQRAQAVGSLDAILDLSVLRPWVIENLQADLRG